MLLVLLVVYVGGTFVQVYRSSHHDGAEPGPTPSSCWAPRSTTARRHRCCGTASTTPSRSTEAACANEIVLTGGRQEGDRFTEATSGYNYLRNQGVPDAALLKEVDGIEHVGVAGRLGPVPHRPGRHQGHPRDRRLPRQAGRGDRRRPRPRRLRVPEPQPPEQRQRGQAAPPRDRRRVDRPGIGYDRLFRIDEAINDDD